MRIALAIFRLAPRGGLEDQCLRLAEELRRRGHEVTLFTTVRGDSDIPTEIVPASGWSNHGRMRSFARRIAALAAEGRHDRLLSFQPVPGVPILFSADLPRDPVGTSPWKRLTPRHRTYAALERGCFAPGAPTRILCLGRRQANDFRQRYGTPEARITLLPPSIDPQLRQPGRRAPERRARLRDALGLAPNEPAWFWLGLQPRIKGLDRAIAALARHPQATLLVGGLAENDARARRFLSAAEASGARQRLRLLGYLDRERLLDTFAAADLLLHPARREVTGGVILEALINGLPVVTTANCGFAEHVEKAGAGFVVGTECPPEALDRAIAEVSGPRNAAMSAAGIRYGTDARLYDGIAVAADLVEAA